MFVVEGNRITSLAQWRSIWQKHAGMNPLKRTRWRKRARRPEVFGACAFLCACLSAYSQNAPSLDDTARLLAGLPVTGTLASLIQTAGWQAHAAAMDKAWKTKEYFQLGPIASWMSSHAPEYYHSTGPMYYMFSGPDFLYADAFFPDASAYILAGLEPIGQVRDRLTGCLIGLRRSEARLTFLRGLKKSMIYIGTGA